MHTLKHAMLILRATEDKAIGIENACEIDQGAIHPKSFIALDGADHLVLWREDALHVAAVLAPGSGRYLVTGGGPGSSGDFG